MILHLIDWIVVVLSPFQLRVRFTRTTLTHYTEMRYSRLNPQGEYDWHVKLVQGHCPADRFYPTDFKFHYPVYE